MHTRILLVEESETIRNVAESLLRQDGHELISIPSGDKALEVLGFTKPDLIISSSDVRARGQKKFFEVLQEEDRFNTLPIIILCNQNEIGLPFPEEQILPKPFETDDLKNKVNAILKTKMQITAVASDGAVITNNIDDDFIDAALGLDKIEVTQSEDITQSKQDKANKVKDETLIGLSDEHEVEVSEEEGESAIVDSLVIHDEKNDINPELCVAKKKDITNSGTGNLEILSDQYGLTDHDAFGEPENPDHDYNWFLNELKKENDPDSKATAKADPAIPDEKPLKFEDNASMIEPFSPNASKPKTDDNTNSGVDKFIDEFKKEVEKMTDDSPESMTISDSEELSSGNDEENDLKWTDSVEKLVPKEFEVFTKQLIKQLSDKLAVRIADKIDSEKLMVMIKNEMIRMLKEK